VGFFLAAWLLFAEDWPEFRGPTGQGISAERQAPLTWSESENVRWKVAVPGRGWSSPAIAAGRVWLTTATSDGVAGAVLRGRTLRLLSYDAATGRELSNVAVFRFTDAGSMHAKNSYASPTPIVEGDRIYVHFGPLGTACARASGEIVWKTTLPYEYVHGNGGSPALYHDLLIVSCDGSDVQYVVALDKNTGAIRWKTPRRRPGSMAFSTPLVIHATGRDQVISTGAHRAVSYDPATGAELWSVDYGDGFSNVPRPVFAHGLVYVCSGFYRPELIAVRPDGSGNVTRTHVVWKAGRSVPLTPSPVVAGEEIYMVSDNGIATCLDARTGRTHWQQRLEGNFSASPVHVAGRIYFLSEEGETTVIQPGPQFRKLATNSLNGQTLASIAPSGGALFIRSAAHLYRIEQGR
jgi:outer membrane protein assembly factor BamB